jgi:hypothetical protein
VLALPAAPATSDVLLAHLFASGFAQALVYRLLRKRFPMTLPWGIDWSPTDPRGPLFRGSIRGNGRVGFSRSKSCSRYSRESYIILANLLGRTSL